MAISCTIMPNETASNANWHPMPKYDELMPDQRFRVAQRNSLVYSKSSGAQLTHQPLWSPQPKHEIPKLQRTNSYLFLLSRLYISTALLKARLHCLNLCQARD